MLPKSSSNQSSSIATPLRAHLNDFVRKPLNIIIIINVWIYLFMVPSYESIYKQIFPTINFLSKLKSVIFFSKNQKVTRICQLDSIVMNDLFGEIGLFEQRLRLETMARKTYEWILLLFMHELVFMHLQSDPLNCKKMVSTYYLKCKMQRNVRFKSAQIYWAKLGWIVFSLHGSFCVSFSRCFWVFARKAAIHTDLASFSCCTYGLSLCSRWLLRWFLQDLLRLPALAVFPSLLWPIFPIWSENAFQ